MLILIEYPTGDVYNQQDNVPCYTAGLLPRWVKEPNRNFTLLSWHAQSSDLNLIEYLWVIKRCIWKLDPVPSNLKALASTIH
ncbi:hypothetical protein TNCV_5131491 [Trichonephila clavipes]|nr:hypothetical protein TNCV_5131491 [Trichonephila clavipes]